MTALVWMIAGLAAIVLAMAVWVLRLQRWSGVYRNVIEAHTRALSEQGSELAQLRSDLLEANIRLDRLDPQRPAHVRVAPAPSSSVRRIEGASLGRLRFRRRSVRAVHRGQDLAVAGTHPTRVVLHVAPRKFDHGRASDFDCGVALPYVELSVP